MSDQELVQAVCKRVLGWTRVSDGWLDPRQAGRRWGRRRFLPTPDANFAARVLEVLRGDDEATVRYDHFPGWVRCAITFSGWTVTARGRDAPRAFLGAALATVDTRHRAGASA